MDGKQRVLHLEDDPNDVRIVRESLLQGCDPYEIHVVCTRREFAEALRASEIDLILADFQLPGFDGLEALAMARQETPDIPFIFVSGVMGEEAAIDALHQGATDYVLKTNLSRLAPAAERAMGAADERRRRKEAEEAVQTKQKFLNAVLESLDTGVVVSDEHGRVTLCNQAAMDLHALSLEPVQPEKWAEHLNLYDQYGKSPLRKEEIPLFRSLEGERVRNVEAVIKSQNGALRTVLVSSQPIVAKEGHKLGAVMALHDISERKQLEQQLNGAQRMEAVGKLAGGIAHDFNNALVAILGFSEILMDKLDSETPMYKELEQIHKAGKRAASLTRQLLAFSRKQLLQPKVLNVNWLLSDMEKMIRRLIGEHINSTMDLKPDLRCMKVDPGKLEQVVMNLAVNARDAMPKGGSLTIETMNVDLDEAFARSHPSVKPGPHVLLRVSDNGCGMSSETMVHIFEPFYTTKGEGKGTGLGLSTVYGIIKQSNGSIWVRSEVGRGTVFEIYFPSVEQEEETENSERAPKAVKSGSETILVVEDEEFVRNLIIKALRGKGYRIVAACGPVEAKQKCGESGKSIDLMLTDVVMPGMGGPELARDLAETRPRMKVLYMSGYTDDTIVDHGILDEDVEFIEKPFTPESLARKIREVLDRR